MMGDDIVELLRRGVDTNNPPDQTDEVMAQAADEIEQLRTDNEKLRQSNRELTYLLAKARNG